MLNHSQAAFNFEPGLTARFPQLEDVFTAVVYSARKGLNGIAADLDQSPSELSRRLNREGDDARPLRVCDMVGILDSTKDLRPIHWLIEKYLQDPESRKDQALSALAAMAPMFIELAAQAGVAIPKKR